VEELATALRSGYRSAVIFCIQRDDAAGMRPHDESDPDFGRALREAARQGVEVYAYRCHVEPGRVRIARPVPVHLATDY
jgi:sugar fermentation stimulation protein A